MGTNSMYRHDTDTAIHPTADYPLGRVALDFRHVSVIEGITVVALARDVHTGRVVALAAMGVPEPAEALRVVCGLPPISPDVVVVRAGVAVPDAVVMINDSRFHGQEVRDIARECRVELTYAPWRRASAEAGWRGFEAPPGADWLALLRYLASWVALDDRTPRVDGSPLDRWETAVARHVLRPPPVRGVPCRDVARPVE